MCSCALCRPKEGLHLARHKCHIVQTVLPGTAEENIIKFYLDSLYLQTLMNARRETMTASNQTMEECASTLQVHSAVNVSKDILEMEEPLAKDVLVSMNFIIVIEID